MVISNNYTEYTSIFYYDFVTTKRTFKNGIIVAKRTVTEFIFKLFFRHSELIGIQLLQF